ncbi:MULTISPECIES: response regulator [unclassified Mesorhizobium]|uniref:response regulator transcription factor n=1 Tax=unclassified Mesorhizobium TaxID=325217 RepID=UPI000FDBBCE7|nr:MULTISPECIES: response regulator [unclassified Mesorhizobium]TGQ08679.1 response regulator transcription factor [Mesorhizobium sp. M2E.F.Ca.ET.219.01.1.1]TGS09645.1 response regulator transcription factor [Mesorhizobium sp. M2E.F.Ca.ET.209.01.1.1]TGT69214.1 response regulator transcription factor [Mesorhizobium sp. M2E.F.Ca.ET.166.01.1.1]TGW01547.1 response regulator transcription factor [Mesorhizobium sp. M2E.F.Ca.ET.154.01.1.1]
MPTLVYVVDDDQSFRTATSRLLRATGYEVVEYASTQQLLEQLPQAAGPTCILLDVQFPGPSGPELQDRLAEIGSVVPIVFLTGHGDIPTSVRAIKAGADDFLTKPVPKETLLEVIDRAVAHHMTRREQQDRLDDLRARIAQLTPREKEVFALVVRGKMNKQIAFELGATERTIKAHRHKVMEKTRVQTVAELVSIAERLGMVAAPTSGKRRD